jgi:hypothetical protein
MTSGTLPITNGGTGSTSASSALSSLGALALVGGVLTGKLVTAASTAASAGLNLPSGIAPTSPNNGDVWYDGSHINARLNGTNVTILGNQGFSMADGTNIVFGTTNGTKIGLATTQKLAFFNATPITQPSTTGTTNGFVANTGSTVTNASTFTGNVGTSTYTIGDVVYALKQLGLLAA